jgi:DNA-directed RNA polymerase specialized sigma24 family protein
MPKQPLQTLVRRLHKLVRPPEGGPTDGELVLLRKADTIRKTQSLGSWLYGVAFRIAHRARAESGRRSGYERQARESAPSDPGMEAAWRELCAVLDVEVHGLGEKYRPPIVLCYLEGLTRDQAARQLGWSLRTLERRLEQGRERLRARLARRGITLTAALLATGLSSQTGLATLPASFVEQLIQAASSLTAGEAGALAGLSPKAIVFAEAALQGAVPAPLKVMAGILLVVTVVAGGAGVLAHQMLAAKPLAANEAQEPSQQLASRDEQRMSQTDRRTLTSTETHCRRAPSPGWAPSVSATLIFMGIWQRT